MTLKVSLSSTIIKPDHKRKKPTSISGPGHPTARNVKQVSTDKVEDPKANFGLLGLQWDTETDMLGLAQRELSSINDVLFTKRQALQDSSMVYDPLGRIAPVTVRAKKNYSRTLAEESRMR